MTQAFADVRVLEFCHVIAGPYATYLLALQGAEVVKIEPPSEPDCVRGRGVDPALNDALMGLNFQTQNANKRALALDLATEEGREVARRLAETADVLIENYRAGAMAAMGLGEAELRRLNPRLIYCSLTGFGQGGAREGVNAYDNVIQAASGLMSTTRGTEGQPMKTGASIVDYASGLAAAFAIASALHRRQRDGVGVYIDCSMLDTALALIGTGVTNDLAAAQRPAGDHPGPAHKESGLGCYATADGLLMLGAFNRRQHERLWTAFERPDFAAWSSWTDMAVHAEEMAADLKVRLLERSAADWETWLHAIGVPAERVRTVLEGVALADGQQRTFLQTLPAQAGGPAIRVPTAPFTFSKDGPAVTAPPPGVGAHTDAVLAEAGYAQDAIAALRRTGVVA